MVAAWDNSVGTSYNEGTSNDLTANLAGSVVWQGSGIRYTNGTNTGSFPLSGVTVTDATAPTLSNVNFVERTSNTAGKISVTSNEAGTVYYKAVADGTGVTQPTVAANLNSWSSAGTIAAGTATQYSVSLASGAQDVYVVVVDAAGNISSQSKVDFAAYVAPVAPTITTTSLQN